MNQIPFTIDGKEYVRVPAVTHGTCIGCAGDKGPCFALPNCEYRSIIFVEVKKGDNAS